MTVRTRLFVGLGVAAVLLLVPGLFAASKLAQLRLLAVEGRSGQAAAVAGLGRMQATTAELDRLARSYVATFDPELGRATLRSADSLRADYERLHASPYGDEAVDLSRTIEEVSTLSALVDDHVRSGRTAQATETLGHLIDRFADADRQIAGIADSIDVVARGDFERAEQVSEAGRRNTLMGLAVALILAGALSVATARSLIGPLRDLGRAMARVADGNFDAPRELPLERSDEIGELMRSFDTMATRLAELDRMKAEFLGIASHELKTPLNVINAYAELIEETRMGELSDRHRSLIAGLSEQANVMSRLVSRLMDLSRLESGAYELAPEPVLIQDLVKGTVAMFAQQADERGVELRVRTSPTAPASAVLDFEIIRDEVLGNLLSNALRYTPDRGWIEIAVDGDEHGVAFTVTDSGPGIPEDHRALIFKKHYTVDRTRGVGSGLGLAIVKEMVELHGGLVSLEESEPGAGACFRIALPLSPVPSLAELRTFPAIGTDDLAGGLDERPDRLSPSARA